MIQTLDAGSCFFLSNTDTTIFVDLFTLNESLGFTAVVGNDDAFVIYLFIMKIL